MATKTDLAERITKLEKDVQEIKSHLKTSQPEPSETVQVDEEPSGNSDETNVGINTLAYIGTGALLISLAFLFFYSFEKNWLSPWTNVIIMLLIGHGLFFFGYKFWDNKYNAITRLLMVVGATLNYFTIYVSHEYMDIANQLNIGSLWATALLSLIVLELAYACFNKNSKFVLFQFVIFGIIASFLVDVWSFFSLTYVLIIILSGLLITYFKKWSPINIPLLVVTYFYFLMLSAVRMYDYVLGSSSIKEYGTQLIFLTIFYIVFLTIAIKNKDEYSDYMFTLNNIGLLISAQIFSGQISEYRIVLSLGVIANVISGVLDKKKWVAAAWAALTFFSILMLNVLNEYYDSLLLAVIGITLLILGFNKFQKQIRIQGLVLIIFAFLKALTIDTANLELGVRVLLFMGFAIIMIIGSILYVKLGDQKK